MNPIKNIHFSGLHGSKLQKGHPFLAANKRVKSDISGSVDSLNSSGAKVEK
nr:MAG TPA: hypothetical protein [Caudoviricetes sp.]